MALAMAFTKECASSIYLFIYLLLYKLVFLGAVSGTLYNFAENKSKLGIVPRKRVHTLKKLLKRSKN